MGSVFDPGFWAKTSEEDRSKAKRKMEEFFMMNIQDG